MARGAIPVTVIGRTAAAPASETNGDATNHHTVVNNGKTWLVVRNADAGGAHTVTEVFQQTVDGQAIVSKDTSIPASSTRHLRLGSPSDYSDPTYINVDSSQLKLSAYTLE